MSESALLLDSINPGAKEVFLENGIEVIEFEKSISQDQLVVLVSKVDFLGIRSGPNVSAEAINYSDKLKAIGCFCVGTNQVALNEATQKGIPVFNAAHENTRSVAEHVIGSVFSLLKRTSEHNSNLHNGVWSKTDEKTYEVRGKTIGIVGYGAIGSQVSVLAEAVNMDVIYFDPNPQAPPHGKAKRAESLDELLSVSDIVSLHVPGSEKTKGLINSEKINIMKKGSYLINAARGEIIDFDAIAEALSSGQLNGVAIDVFKDEPSKCGDKFSNLLAEFPNALLTPHIAGSTTEAQASIGEKIASKLLGFSLTGTTVGAVNLPEIAPGYIQGDTRIISLHDNKPGVLSDILAIVADYDHNIISQTLKVKDSLGLVAIDIEGIPSPHLINELDDITSVNINRFIY
jgi:D-3-phosphoglycerate dehydrogenase